MTDVVDKETRSRMMSGIRGKDTKPEMLVRRALHARGFRYLLHSPNLHVPKATVHKSAGKARYGISQVSSSRICARLLLAHARLQILQASRKSNRVLAGKAAEEQAKRPHRSRYYAVAGLASARHLGMCDTRGPIGRLRYLAH